MKLLEILKKILCCGVSETASSNDVLDNSPKNINKVSQSFVAIDDIRIVAGDNTLSLVYDACLGGLHNALSYDPCSGALQDCFSELNTIIGENLEEVYDSIIVKTGENQYLLNIGVNLLVGAGKLFPKLCEDLIDVFYHVIKKFIDNNIVDNKVGIYSAFTDDGTSLGLFALMRHLKQDGYMCCGVVATIKGYSLKRTKVLDDFSYVDVEKLAKDNEDFDIRKLPSLLHDEVVRKMSSDAEHFQDNTDGIAQNKSVIMEQYGQVRTMADILIGMNEQYHFTNSEDAVAAVMKYIGEQSPCHFAISGEAFHFIADALYSPKAFVNGKLNKDAFLGNFTVSQFDKNWDDAMYRYYYAKIWKLICYFNEFRRYTSPSQIYKDLKNTITSKYYIMTDGLYSYGGYPQHFFRCAIEEAWEKIAPNNSIDSKLLDEYMFKNHEASVKAIGLEATIEKYFEQDYCWTDVYFPEEIGSAPVYIERKKGNKRMFLKSCGEGKGPNNNPEILEFNCAYRLLIEDSKYDIWVGDNLPDLFVPKDDMSLPIYYYSNYYSCGKMLFENEADKNVCLKKELERRQIMKKSDRKTLINSFHS